MYIRRMKDSEIVPWSTECLQWGPEYADRMIEQAMLGLRGGDFDPIFLVADLSDPLSRDYTSLPIGFGAYQRTMRMANANDLIWLAVHPQYQGRGVGKKLVEFMLEATRSQGGTSMSVVTKEPTFYHKFGFTTAAHLGKDWVEMIALLRLTQ